MTTEESNLPELNDVSRADDHTWPMRRALRNSAVALTVIALISLALWGWQRDLPGVWGALLGVGIAGGFMLITVVITILTAQTTPATMMATVLGSWLAKIAVVLIIMLVIKDMTFYDHTAFAVTVLVSLAVLLAAETWSVVKAQNVYI